MKEAKSEYYLSMILRFMAHIIANYSNILLNMIFPSLRSKHNMNLDEASAKVFLSTVTSAYFYGSLIGAIFVKQVAGFNTKKLWRISVAATIVINLTFQY